MAMLDAVRRHRADTLEIARKHGATNVRIFGSVVRGDDGPGSDIDLLVETAAATSLARRVDVVADRGLNPFIRDQVFREAQPV